MPRKESITDGCVSGSSTNSASRGARNKDVKQNKNANAKGRNHPAWYTREGVPHQVGLNFAALTSVEQEYTVGSIDYRINGAYQILTIPALHIDESESFFRMMSHLYSMIRERNAGAANYNPTIVAKYVMALEYLYAGVYSAARMVQSVRTVMSGWRDSPYLLPAVVGVDNYEEFTANLANFTNDLSLIAKEVGALPIPHDMTVFERIRWLYTNVFMDSNSSRGSPIAFVPVIPDNVTEGIGAFMLRLRKADGGSATNFSEVTTWRTIISDLQTVLNAVLSDELFAILRGDLIKAYGYRQADLVSLINQPLSVVYDEYALAQIVNANVPMSKSAPSGLSIMFVDQAGFPAMSLDDRDDGSGWGITVPANTLQRSDQDEFFVQSPVPNPDAGYLLSVTRLMNTLQSGGEDNETTRYIKECGGDLLLALNVITGVANDAVTRVTLGDVYEAALSSIQSTAISGIVTLGWISHMFNKFPLIYAVKSGGPDGYIAGTNYLWNVDEWATMSEEQLKQLNELANRSLFYSDAPRRGRF